MSFIDTLIAAFKGESARVPLARGATSPWFFADPGGGRAPFEYTVAVRRAYLENPIVQRAVRLVAEGIGGAPLKPTDDRLLALVGETSAGQSLLETLASYLLLHGNAYVQVLKDARGRPVELFALRPERVTVLPGEDGWPNAYAYDVAGRQLVIPVLDEDASPNLIHIHHFHERARGRDPGGGMTRVWFAGDLETVATFWRILRRDGVTLGFTTHDEDLWFDGVLHRASPGMIPASIRKSADFEADSAEVHGAITHDAIGSADLAAGRFDGAQVRIGVVDWETKEHEVLYAGTIGTVSEEDGQFSADLTSRKAELQRDPTPRTSPACRAEFCGPDCNLNPARFTREVRLTALDPNANAAAFAPPLDPALYAGGTLRWLGGPQAGAAMGVMAGNGEGALVLDAPLAETIPSGTTAFVREGCDHTLDTCSQRFDNAVNFRGEPFLPGNDLLTRYPNPSS